MRENTHFETISSAIVSHLSWVCEGQRFITHRVVGSEEPFRFLDSAAVETRSELSLRKRRNVEVLERHFRWRMAMQIHNNNMHSVYKTLIFTGFSIQLCFLLQEDSSSLL